MEWMVLPLKRYAQFGGRSRRKEYWMFVLFTVIVGAVLGVIDEALGLTLDDGANRFSNNGVLGGIFSLATFIPSLAVAVRRLHDTDRSGWWLLMPVAVVVVLLILAFTLGDPGTDFTGVGIGLIVALVIGMISGIALLVFLCLDGTSGPNRFGDDPKGVSYEGVFD